MKTKHLRISCFDLGPDGPADRYSVLFEGPGFNESVHQGRTWCVGMGATPFHPQGICQHSEASPAPHAARNKWKHLGKPIALCELPADCLKVVAREIQSLGIPPE